MSTIEELEPASQAEVELYQPYYFKDKDKLKILPIALSLYSQGYLEGQRQIEGGQDVPFAATWYVSNASKLPLQSTRCRLQFEGKADLSYEMTLRNSDFIDYLMEAIATYKQVGAVDFPQNFYRKLLHADE